MGVVGYEPAPSNHSEKELNERPPRTAFQRPGRRAAVLWCYRRRLPHVTTLDGSRATAAGRVGAASFGGMRSNSARAEHALHTTMASSSMQNVDEVSGQTSGSAQTKHSPIGSGGAGTSCFMLSSSAAVAPPPTGMCGSTSAVAPLQLGCITVWLILSCSLHPSRSNFLSTEWTVWSMIVLN